MKSVNLFFGKLLASSVAGYQISVTSVRDSLVAASVRLGSTKTVVVTPTGYGPGWRGSITSVAAYFGGGAAATVRAIRNRASNACRMVASPSQVLRISVISRRSRFKHREP